MKFYKYIKHQFLDDMLKFGRIRIGSLYEYRDSENKEIEDLNEGKVTNYTYLDEVEFTSNDDIPDRLKSVIQFSPDIKKGKVIFKGSHAFIKNSVEDTYVYCMTCSPSKKVMNHFNCDACVEITDLMFFRDQLTVELFKDGWITKPGYLNDKCKYADRLMEVFLKGNIDYNQVYFMKDKVFSHQDEYRLVFLPSDRLKPTQGHIFTIPAIKKCLRVIKL